MRAVKILAIAAVAYLGVVVAFETLLGIVQPTSESTLVIATFEGDGTRHERVVASLESGGDLYVAANHWPRAWYRRALANPEVEVTLNGETAAYRAVPVSGAEHDRVDAENPVPVPFRFLTGFPPRSLVRLEAR